MAKTSTMADRIRALIKDGRSAGEIAAILGIPRQRVYVIKSADKRKAPAKRKYVKSGRYVKKITPTPAMPFKGTLYLSWPQRAKALLTGRIDV